MLYNDLLEYKYEFNKSVFCDIKLDVLLSKFFSKAVCEDLIEDLRHPLPPSLIKKRQELFCELNNPKVIASVSSLCDILMQLTLDNDMFSKASDERYKQVLFFSMVCTYIELVKKFAECSATSELLSEHITKFINITNSEVYKNAVTNIQEINVLLLVLENIGLHIKTISECSSRFYLQNKTGACITEELLKAAAALGLDKYLSDNNNNSYVHYNKLSEYFTGALCLHFPVIFEALSAFYDKYKDFFDLSVILYRKQFLFYLNMHKLINELKAKNIPLCIPEITSEKCIRIKSAYDITLLSKAESEIVPNDALFNKEEAFFILTGANGGGKTTYLRAVAVCVVLACAGCEVPAHKAAIYPFTGVFTHFPADEKFDLIGRLRDEQEKTDIILKDADSSSLVFLNETFSSTNEDLSSELSVSLIKKLREKDITGLFVTHNYKAVKEIKDKIPNIGFLEAMVTDEKAAKRTYKIVNKTPDNLSYASTILEKYGLTKENLTERFGL